MVAILLGLVCSVAWGLSDFLGGVESRRRALATVLVVSQFCALGAALIAVAITADDPPSGHATLTAAAAGVFSTGAIAFFFRALSLAAFRIVTPIVATGAAIPVVYGAFQGDSLSALQVVCMVACLGGLALAARTEESAPPTKSYFQAIACSLAAMVAIGSAFVAFDEAATESVAWTVTIARTVGLTMIVVGCLAIVGRPEIPGRGLAGVAMIGVLDTSAWVLFGVATDQGALGVVAVLASLYPAVTVTLARAILSERLSPAQTAGVMITIGGVAGLAVA